MPLDRLFHAVAGHSEKVNRLTDLEFRVWTQYLLSADDFGVMRLSAAPIQADNDRLSEVSARKVQRALENIVAIGLLNTYEHQGKSFVFQDDWQKYQKVEYPRTTTMPKPPASALSLCDEATAWLFTVHPGGKRLPKMSASSPQEVAEELPTTSQEVAVLARAHAHPTANANGQRLEANGQRPTAVEGMPGRNSYLSDSKVVFTYRGHTLYRGTQYDSFVQRFDGDRALFDEWLRAEIEAVYASGGRPGSLYEFVDERWKKRAPNTLSTIKTSGNVAALQEFVRQGGKR